MFALQNPDSSIGIQSHFMPPPLNGMSGSATGYVSEHNIIDIYNKLL